MIKRIRIQNFRSLRDVTVDLAPLTVLIGRSGSGKSNFVNAIRYLKATIQLPGNSEDLKRLVQRIGESNDWFIAFNRLNTTKLAIQILFDVPNVAGEFTYEIERRFDGNFALEQISLGQEQLFCWTLGSPRGRNWVVSPKSHIPPELDGQPMLGRLPGIRECQLAFLYLSRGLGCYDFPSQILASASQPPSMMTGLWDDGSNALATANNLTLDLNGLRRFDEIVGGLKAMNPSVATVTTTDNGTKLVVGHTLPDGQILTLPIQQESEGFRRVFAHLLAVYQQPERQVLVFEEPEKGIHPGALSLLADTFRAVTESGRVQILLITHSPALLAHFSVDEIRVVEMKDGETRVGPVSSEQRESLEEHLLSTDELLTVDPARIDNAGVISGP